MHTIRDGLADLHLEIFLSGEGLTDGKQELESFVVARQGWMPTSPKKADSDIL